MYCTRINNKMIRKLLKKIKLADKLNNMFVKYKVAKNFLKCSEKEIEQLIFYNQFITKSSLVFDVGANVGSRTKLFLNMGARVVAFEPQPNLYNHLKDHLDIVRKVKIEQLALGDQRSIKQMLICEAHVLSSLSKRWINATQKSGRFSNYNWEKSIDVNVSTLDEQIIKYGIPDFIKIDVEGYELEVLKGLSKEITCIVFEFTSEEIEQTFKCIDYLNSLSNCLFRVSFGEEHKFTRPWKSCIDFKGELHNDCIDKSNCWGDIFVKLKK